MESQNQSPPDDRDVRRPCWPTHRTVDSESGGDQMQARATCRVHPLQTDEGCIAAHALIETMLTPTTHRFDD